MAADDSQDRNLPASQRKLRKAREEGQVARSRDLGHFFAVGVGLMVVTAAAPLLTDALQALLRAGLRFDAATLAKPGVMTERLAALTGPLLLLVLPLGALMALLGAAAAVASGGWVFSWKAMAPQFSRMNPIDGIGRLFSKQQLADTLKSCLLALILGLIGYAWLRSEFPAFAHVQTMPLPAAFAAALDRVFWGLVLLVIALAAFAAVDVPLQRFMHAQRLRMSHQELKQEHKEMEGNPEIKGRLRQKMREMARKRMLAAVPTADLVVMNPTHYAVALKYEEGGLGAPRVVAKGTDLVALKIRDLAREAKVPVLEAPPLARALWAHTELDHEIPLALYGAVAQVLAWVYQLRAAMAGRGPMPGSLPPLPVPPEMDPHDPASGRAPAAA